MADKRRRLEDLYGVVADAHSVDWDDVRSSAGSDLEAALVDNLRIISAIAQAHQQSGLDGDALSLPFPSWAHLQLLSPLGSGAYGETYLAWDDTLQREVCLKLFKADAQGLLAGSQQSALLEEARNLARLRAPFVVRVYGAATDRGRVGFWMEYVRGQTLHQRVSSKGPLEAGEVARVGRELAQALAAVHGAGLLHRDVKAANVLQDEDGDVFLADFGAGLMLGPEHAHRQDAPTGTPLYMAPEVLERGVSSPSSDIYSLGVLLFHLLTGRFPVEAETTGALLEEHRAGRRTRLSDLRQDVPAALVRVVEHCLEASPANRPSHAEEIEERLAGLERPRGWSWRRGLAVGLPMLSLVAIAGLFVGQHQALHAPEEIGHLTRLTYSGGGSVPVLSPDGQTIFYRESGELRSMSPDGRDQRVIDLPEGVVFTPWTWTADGRGLIGQGRFPDRQNPVVMRLSPSGGPPEVLQERATFGALSPDGRELAYFSYDGFTVFVKDLDTGESRQLVELFAEGEAAYKPRWSPDGSLVTYYRWRGIGHEIWCIRADGTGDRLIDTEPFRPRGLYDFAPDGKALLVGGEEFGTWSLWRVPLDGSPRVRLTQASEMEEMHVSRDATGTRLVFQRGLDATWFQFLDTGSGNLERPVTMDVANWEGCFPAVGGPFVFQVLVNGRLQIWSASLDGSDSPRPLVRAAGLSCSLPRPDGEGGIVYLRGEIGRARVFGQVKWTQRLWRRGASGRDERADWPVGDQVTWLAPGGVRDGKILYGAPDGSAMGLFVCDREGPPRLLLPGRADAGWETADWGTSSDHVLVVREAELESGSTRVLERLDVVTGASEHLLSSAEMSTDDERGQAYIVGVASAFHEPVLALRVYFVGSRESVYFRYDPRDRSLVEMGSVRHEDSQHPEEMSWSQDGTRLALEMHRERTDVHRWEKEQAAMPTRGRNTGRVASSSR